MESSKHENMHDNCHHTEVLSRWQHYKRQQTCFTRKGDHALDFEPRIALDGKCSLQSKRKSTPESKKEEQQPPRECEIIADHLLFLQTGHRTEIVTLHVMGDLSKSFYPRLGETQWMKVCRARRGRQSNTHYIQINCIVKPSSSPSPA